MWVMTGKVAASNPSTVPEDGFLFGCWFHGIVLLLLLLGVAVEVLVGLSCAVLFGAFSVKEFILLRWSAAAAAFLMDDMPCCCPVTVSGKDATASSASMDALEERFASKER